MKLELKDLVAYSDLIVVGEVKSKRVFTEKGRILTSVIISEKSVLKGTAPKQIEIVQYGGRTEKMTSYVPGMPRFVENEKVLLFLEQPKNRKTFVVTGMSQGKFTVASGPDGQKRFVIPASLSGIELVRKGSDTMLTASGVHQVVSSLDSLSQKISELQK